MGNDVDVTILPRTEDLVAWLVWLVPVIFLQLWDVWKAWKRRAFWIPGQALVLNALIIQLLSFIDYSHISVYSGSGYQSEKVEVILVKNQLVIDSGRLMMCVLIAYLLPGMARSGSIKDGNNLAVLALSIIFHVVSELRSVWEVEKRNESLSAFAASSVGFTSAFLILAIIYLLGLLIRAVMIGRSIRKIMSQKIPSALSSCTRSVSPRRNDYETKDHVLKCWIVVRLSQPDYVLARSGLGSRALPTVTACIVVDVIKWRYVQFTDHESLNSVTKRTLVQFVIVGQFVIVLIGWIVLFVRWVTSRMHGDIVSGDYFKSMSIEDAQTELTAYFMRLFGSDKRIQEKRIREMNKKIRYIFSVLWYPRHSVQKLFQILSMQNPPRWLTSTNGWLSQIKRRVINYVSIAVVDDRQFSKYNETLRMLLIRGESDRSLWKANQRGFREVERYMDQGHEDGKRSPSQLIDLLRLGGVTATEEEAHLQQSWKRTAVSFIHIMMICYDDGSDDSVIEDTIKCYIQAWEYMNFVDGLNQEVKSLGRQADEQFDSLQHCWNKRAQPEMLNREIKRPLRELIQQWERYTPGERSNLQKSSDLTEVANYWLFETWRAMHISDAGITISAAEINRIRCELAKVYFVYMKEGLKEAVLQKCSKLAEEGMEEEILDVALLAAKAQGLLDKVRERNNTDQASTSSTIPPVNEEVGEGNDPENQIQKASPNSEGQTWHTAPMRWLRLLNEEFDVKKNNNSGRWSTKSSNSGRWSTKSSNSGRWSTVTVGNNVKGSDVKRNNNVKSNNFVSGVVGEGNLANNTVGNNTAVGHSAMGRNFVGNNSGVRNNSVFGDGQAKRRSANSNNSNNAEIVMIGKGSVGHNSVGSVGNNSVRRRNNTNTIPPIYGSSIRDQPE